jgi:hypothetical protein
MDRVDIRWLAVTQGQSLKAVSGHSSSGRPEKKKPHRKFSPGYGINAWG